MGGGGAISAVRHSLRDRRRKGALPQLRAGLDVAKSATYVSSVALRAQAAGFLATYVTNGLNPGITPIRARLRRSHICTPQFTAKSFVKLSELTI